MMEIAIIAHDGKKADMVQFLNKNKLLLQKENIKLIATGTTGSKAENAGFKVKRMLSGPLGGDAQIAARVAEGKTKMVLFFISEEAKVQWEVRLVDSSTKRTGHVQVRSSIDNSWGYICDDYWNTRSAGLVCKDLGFE